MYKKLLDKKENIVVVGLGYVGLPLAVSFARKGIKVIGFDLNKNKINKYINGEDPTNEVGNEELRKVNIDYTCDPRKISEGKFIVVAVPTPVKEGSMPDLSMVESASKLVGENMTKGSIVVYESTVYPGVTEDVCIPILEKYSGMKCGVDFKVGYSPERISPGEKVHTLEKIVKIVSGSDEEALNEIAKVYELIIEAGVYKASSIKVAEAAKVIENTQRDVNIAFVNELSLIFDKLGIDTKEVIDAAASKWNFIKFNPGLVGGHCIGVDPYYLIHRAKMVGVETPLISSARKTNDNMSKYVVDVIIERLNKYKLDLKKSKVLILGITFKENVPDIRNSKVVDIIKGLEARGLNVSVTDNYADNEETYEEYGINLINIDDNEKYDAVVVAVSHDEYKNVNYKFYKDLLNDNHPILIDIKGVITGKEKQKHFDYWTM
jgi:UDP-N-acetyl-D-galactosamine dehydrogenase